MRRVRYYVTDVFTDIPLAGNPVAVFPDRSQLSEEELSAITRELNLSETVFIEEPTEAGALKRLRIFTPGREIPLAGHPVVGTWYTLAELGLVDLDAAIADGLASAELIEGGVERVSFRHQLNVGVLELNVYRQDGNVTGVAMDQVPPIFFDEADPAAAAAALGLDESAIRRSGFPPQCVSTGLPVMIVGLASLEDLKSIKINAAALDDLIAGVEGCVGVYVFTTAVDEDWALARTRGFFPEVGVSEDAATGSAAGALGGYMVRHGIVSPQPTAAFQLHQGVEINRPSRIGVEVTAEGGEVTRVRVVGSCVVIIEAEMLLP